MVLADVNVLVHAFRSDSSDHAVCRAWMRRQAEGPEPIAISEIVLSGFLRVATHPRIFDPPSTLREAVAFAEAVRNLPGAIRAEPGPRHWEIFVRLCVAARARGGLISDAYLPLWPSNPAAN